DPEFWMVRKSFSPATVLAAANPNKLARVVEPTTTDAPATEPLPKLRTMYIGRSATIATVDVIWTDTPTALGPTPSVGSKTRSVNRLCGATVTCRTIGGPEDSI